MRVLGYDAALIAGFLSRIYNIESVPKEPIGPDPDKPDKPIGPDPPNPTPDKPVGPGGDDDHTFVNYEQEDNQKFAPSVVDPAEAYLFLSTNAEAEKERSLWDNYSKVQSGYGLGTVRQNSLARHNFEHERKMFTGCFKNPQPKGLRPVEVPYSSQRQPFWTPAIQNEYGNVTFENAFEQKALQHFTSPVPEDSQRQTFEKSHSIYHPNFALDRMKYPLGRPVAIPELPQSINQSGGFYGLPRTKGGYANNQEVMDTMYKYTKQMDPHCHSANPHSYDIPRSGSSRLG
jgi:hypothetical protein